jgi:hypothetical protein
MRIAFLLFVHLIASVAKLLGSGGTRGLLAETLAVKHRLLIVGTGQAPLQIRLGGLDFRERQHECMKRLAS